MKLISCVQCHVVLDQDRMYLDPEDAMNYDRSLITDKCEWVDGHFWLCVPCPVCDDKIVTDVRVA